MVQQTLEGAVRSLTRRAHTVADACVEQAEAAERLREDADAAYDEAIRRLLEATADGTLLRGEVLARWQEFVGTGELLKTLEAKVGWLRDRMVNAVKGKPQQAERVTVAVESGLETLILEHAEAAAERAEASWRTLAPGQDLLSDVGEDLGRASRGLRRQAERAVRDWQQDVLEMVRTEGADKRTTARFLAYGVNGLVGRADGRGLRQHRRAHRRRGRHRRRQRGARARSCSRRSSATRPCARLAERGPAQARGPGPGAARRGASPLPRPARQPRASTPRRPSGCATRRARVDDLRYAAARDYERAHPLTSGRRVHRVRRPDGVPTRLGAHIRARARGRTMTSLLEGARRLVSRGSDLGDRIEALERAGRGRAGPPRRPGRSTRPRRPSTGPPSRLRLSADHTVVAIAGATGSGKSSTFNALAGLELSAVGVRRPTTSWATACVWGKDGRRGAARVARHPAAPPGHARLHARRAGKDGPARSQGVVLLDLPDHDSTEVSHHLEVDRLVELADLMVWVLDPQKYADAAIHDRYLAPLATPPGRHARRPQPHRRGARATAAQAMVDDVRRLLDADGLRRRARARHSAPARARASTSCAREIAERVRGQEGRPGARLEADVRRRGRAPRRGDRHRRGTRALVRAARSPRSTTRFADAAGRAHRRRRGRALHPAARPAARPAGR